MSSVFEIIAEPHRRAILTVLAGAERSVGDLEQELQLPQPTVSKHLRVLRQAGLVESRTDAQRRIYWLKPQALREVDAWLAPFRAAWTGHLNDLEAWLDQTQGDKNA